MKYRICVPSYKRQTVIKDSIIPRLAKYKRDINVIVFKDEVEGYKEVLPKSIKVIGIDADIKGIVAKRNWIFENLFDKSLDFMMMLDDDIYNFEFKTGTSGEKVRDNDILLFFEEDYLKAKAMKVNYFGYMPEFVSQGAIKYARRIPYEVNGYIVAGVSGYLSNSIMFDRKVNIMEDTEFTLANIYRYGGLLKNMMVWFKCLNNKMGNTQGGLATYRNRRLLIEDRKYITNKYGMRADRYFKARRRGVYAEV